MKFTGYILKKLIPFFLVALFFIALILNLVDLFMNISSYLENKSPVKDVLLIMYYYIPKTIWYASPIAFLFSVSYILSNLYAGNEMEALFASGISLYRFVTPILIFALLGSFGMFFLEDKLVVQTLEKKEALQKQLLGLQEAADNDDVVVISDASKIIYKAKYYSDETKILNSLYIIFRDDEKNLLAILFCKNARWDDNTQVWNLDSAVQYVPVENTLEIVPVTEEFTSRLTESYETFQSKNVNVESITSKDAKKYITHLKKSGLPYYEEQSVYYKKFAFPLIFLISAFMAIGLTGKTKKNVLLISLALSICAVVLYYVFQMCTMVLAKTELIPPFMGAWLPDIVFIMLSVFLLKFSRT